MRQQPLREMDRRRLAVELVIATKRMNSHRQERDRDWCRQRCDDPHWPCRQRRQAEALANAVVDELRSRDQVVEDTRAEWR